MTYYRKHNCARNHRSYHTAAKCIWPKAHSITGEGSFACLAWCGSGPWSTACPEGEPVSAVMEPQTNNLVSCAGNGTPLPWEIEWAKNRPAVVGPTPDWDGPRPKWPTGDPA